MKGFHSALFFIFHRGVSSAMLFFAQIPCCFTLTVMAPVATPDDEKLYANYGETPFLEDVLSR
jgi:hypothetical protein